MRILSIHRVLKFDKLWLSYSQHIYFEEPVFVEEAWQLVFFIPRDSSIERSDWLQYVSLEYVSVPQEKDKKTATPESAVNPFFVFRRCVLKWKKADCCSNFFAQGKKSRLTILPCLSGGLVEIGS